MSDKEKEATHRMLKLAARILGKQGGLKGGPARAKALSPERRREIAKRAAEARWGKSEP